VSSFCDVILESFITPQQAQAFMPASRSGVRDASEMEKLVEQEIRCRIIKLDAADEDVVVDRRIVAEDNYRITKSFL